MNTLNIIRRLSLTFVILLALVPGRSTRAAAGDAYVSPVGSDLNDCLTPATACATVPAGFAKATAGATVYIAVGTYTGSGNAVLVLNKDITLSGGWTESFSARSGLSTLDAQGQRIVILASNCLTGSVTATLDRIGIVNGYTGAEGAGIILGCTSLTVTASRFAGNYAGGSFGGSAVYVSGNSTLRIEQSLIDARRAGHPDSSSAIYSGGQVTLINTTMSGEGSSDVAGFGIHTFVGSLTLRQVTLTGFAQGLYVIATPLSIDNSIMYGSRLSDCFRDTGYGGVVTLTGRNYFGKQNGCSPRSEDRVGVNPWLGPLSDNGGLTATHALPPASPARGDGLTCASSSTVDQRGASRPAACSPGAYDPLLNVAMSVAGSFKPGGTVTYTLQVAPFGASALNDVSVVDELEAPLLVVPGSATANVGAAAISGNRVTWAGSADPAVPVTVTFQAQVDATAPRGPVTNVARATWNGFADLSNAIAADSFEHQYLPGIASRFCRDLRDDFSDPTSGWPVFESNLRRLEYLNGEYRLLTKQAGYIYLMSAPSCPREVYQVTADMHWQGAAGSDIGLMFGDDRDQGHVYLFLIDTTAAEVSVIRFNPDGSATGLLGGNNSDIRTGSGVNQLSVTVDGGAIWLELNGHALTPLWGQSPKGLTWVGLAAAPYLSQPVVDARFDNFNVVTLNVAGSPAAVGSETVADLPELVRPWHSIAPDDAP